MHGRNNVDTANNENSLDWNAIMADTGDNVKLNKLNYKACTTTNKKCNIQNNYDLMRKHTIEKIENMEDHEILNISSLLARNLKFQLKRKYDIHDEKKEFLNWLVTTLEWINKSCMILMNKHDQTMQFTEHNNNTIPRNSYKFCEFAHECKYYYSKDTRCYSQHFVYNLVGSDITHLLKFINNIKIYNEHTYNEIRISVNTITYVVNHMYGELDKLKKINKNKYNNYLKNKFRICQKIKNT